METETDVEIDTDALVQLLAPKAKLRIVAAVLEEGSDGSQFNPSAVYEYDGVSRDAWYRYHEDLEEAGVIERDGKIGNSPLYRLTETPLVVRLRELADVMSEQGDRDD